MLPYLGIKIKLTSKSRFTLCFNRLEWIVLDRPIIAGPSPGSSSPDVHLKSKLTQGLLDQLPLSGRTPLLCSGSGFLARWVPSSLLCTADMDVEGVLPSMLRYRCFSSSLTYRVLPMGTSPHRALYLYQLPLFCGSSPSRFYSISQLTKVPEAQNPGFFSLRPLSCNSYTDISVPQRQAGSQTQFSFLNALLFHIICDNLSQVPATGWLSDVDTDTKNKFQLALYLSG